MLEKVQERFVRLVSDAKGKTYEEKLSDMGLTTLKERRKRGDMIETFKTMNGFNRVHKENWFLPTQDGARETRRTTTATAEGVEKKTHILERECSRLEIRKNFFTVRIVNDWNNLPEEVKKQPTVNSFKSAYDRWQKNKKQASSSGVTNNDGDVTAGT